MRKFTAQELNCKIETSKQKLKKLDLCSVAWERLYGERSLNLEEFRKYTTRLLDDYTNQHSALLQTEEPKRNEADTSEMYHELQRLKEELRMLDEAKEKIKRLDVYSRTQESEESRALRNPIELQLFENLYNFVAQERDDLQKVTRETLKANNAKLKNDTDLTLRELKGIISSYEQSLIWKQSEASRYMRDFGVNNPTLDKEISEIKQSLDRYKSRLHNLKSK